MGENEYSKSLQKNARQWTWDCPVEGCKSENGRKSGGRNPIKHMVANRMAIDHMVKFHPELDKHSGIVRKVK